MTLNPIVFVIILVVVAVAIEYITRGLPSPWRYVILTATAIALLLWLLIQTGVMSM